MILIQWLDNWPKQKVEINYDRRWPDIWGVDICILKLQVNIVCRELSERVTAFINSAGDPSVPICAREHSCGTPHCGPCNGYPRNRYPGY